MLQVRGRSSQTTKNRVGNGSKGKLSKPDKKGGPLRVVVVDTAHLLGGLFRGNREEKIGYWNEKKKPNVPPTKKGKRGGGGQNGGQKKSNTRTIRYFRTSTKKKKRRHPTHTKQGCEGN